MKLLQYQRALSKTAVTVLPCVLTRFDDTMQTLSRDITKQADPKQSSNMHIHITVKDLQRLFVGVLDIDTHHLQK